MPTYDRVVGVDEDYNFPEEVRYNLDWAKKGLGSENLDDLILSGSYIRAGNIYASIGYPIDANNTYTEVEVRRIGTAPMRATMSCKITYLSNGRVREFTRTQSDGVWSNWLETGVIHRVLGSENLDDLVSSGDYVRSGSIYKSIGYPIDDTSSPYTYINLQRIGTAPMRATMTATIIGDDTVRSYARRQTADGWEPWIDLSSGGSSGTGATATTEMESKGHWTSLPAEESYLDELAKHDYVTKFEIGRSVQNRPIWALQVGPFEEEYPHQKRSVLFTAGMHGNEQGPREGALRFIRDLLNPTSITYDPVHMIAVIVPTVNPDGIVANTRANANDVNLNRDFVAYSQPETQAIRDLVSDPNRDFVAYIDAHNGGYGNAVSTRWGDQDPDATATVKALGKRLDDQIADRYFNAGMPWRMYGEPGLGGIPGDGTLIDGGFMRLGGQFGIPSVLIEVPRTTRSLPSWQAQITLEAFHEVWEYTAIHREEYKAAKTAAGF